jgi:hypothetical protein
MSIVFFTSHCYRFFKPPPFVVFDYKKQTLEMHRYKDKKPLSGYISKAAVKENNVPHIRPAILFKEKGPHCHMAFIEREGKTRFPQLSHQPDHRPR